MQGMYRVYRLYALCRLPGFQASVRLMIFKLGNKLQTSQSLAGTWKDLNLSFIRQ